MDFLKQIGSILPQKEKEKLLSIKDEIHDAWHKKQIFRTETQARYAVLNSFKYPTKASRYWQAVREQMVHFDELILLSFRIRRKEIELREVEQKIKKADAGSFEYEKLLVDRDELLFRIKTGYRVAQDRVREIMQWSLLKKENNDGSFDDKDVNSHQKESLFQSVYNRAQITSLTSEEQLSVNGILYGLASEPKNRQFLEQQKEKK